MLGRARAGSPHLTNSRPSRRSASDEAKSVLLRVGISAEGAVEHVAVAESSGLPSFDEYAVRTMYSYGFHPALKADGKPTDISIMYRFRFQSR